MAADAGSTHDLVGRLKMLSPGRKKLMSKYFMLKDGESGSLMSEYFGVALAFVALGGMIRDVNLLKKTTTTTTTTKQQQQQQQENHELHEVHRDLEPPKLHRMALEEMLKAAMERLRALAARTQSLEEKVQERRNMEAGFQYERMELLKRAMAAEALVVEKAEAEGAWRVEKAELQKRVAEADAQRGYFFSKMSEAEIRVAELGRLRAEDGKANAKLVEIYAGREQGWKTEKMKLKQEIELLKERVSKLVLQSRTRAEVEAAAATAAAAATSSTSAAEEQQAQRTTRNLKKKAEKSSQMEKLAMAPLESKKENGSKAHQSSAAVKLLEVDGGLDRGLLLGDAGDHEAGAGDSIAVHDSASLTQQQDMEAELAIILKRVGMLKKRRTSGDNNNKNSMMLGEMHNSAAAVTAAAAAAAASKSLDMVPAINAVVPVINVTPAAASKSLYTVPAINAIVPVINAAQKDIVDEQGIQEQPDQPCLNEQGIGEQPDWPCINEQQEIIGEQPDQPCINAQKEIIDEQREPFVYEQGIQEQQPEPGTNEQRRIILDGQPECTTGVVRDVRVVVVDEFRKEIVMHAVGRSNVTAEISQEEDLHLVVSTICEPGSYDHGNQSPAKMITTDVSSNAAGDNNISSSASAAATESQDSDAMGACHGFGTSGEIAAAAAAAAATSQAFDTMDVCHHWFGASGKTAAATESEEICEDVVVLNNAFDGGSTLPVLPGDVDTVVALQPSNADPLSTLSPVQESATDENLVKDGIAVAGGDIELTVVEQAEEIIAGTDNVANEASETEDSSWTESDHIAPENPKVHQSGGTQEEPVILPFTGIGDSSFEILENHEICQDPVILPVTGIGESSLEILENCEIKSL